MTHSKKQQQHKMRVLIGCEESQAVCKAFRELGHEAYSNDLQECSGGHPEWHIQASVLEIIKIRWDLAIFHPPCTFLSHAGNGYFNVERYGENAVKRQEMRNEAMDFFRILFAAPIPKICIENPVGAMNSIMPPTQVIEPYYFGDGHKKRTCLWLKGLPPLFHARSADLFSNKTHVKAEPIYIDKSGKNRYFTDAISGSRTTTQKERSKTFPGIANAMATQWGGGILIITIHSHCKKAA